MKVLLVNTYMEGGAAKACIRLFDGLKNENIDASVLFREGHPRVQDHHVFETAAKPKSKLQKLLLKIFRKIGLYSKRTKRLQEQQKFKASRIDSLEMFSFPDSPYDITTSPLYKQADVINLHWVSGFLDYTSFFAKNNKPVVWTLHDINPFSGGEHYLQESIGMDAQGLPIKREFADLELKTFDRVIQLKKEALKNVRDLHVVTLCQWMSDQVAASEVFSRFPRSVIPNGINTETFKIQDKELLRTELQLPQKKKIVLFVSHNLMNHRKGFSFLLDALKKLDRNDYLLLAVGYQREELSGIENLTSLGMIKSEAQMAKVYATADVFVTPSLIDNLPNTIVESFMCGTPVIGFPRGGIPEMVAHGVNGILTEEISSESLKNALELFLDNTFKFDRENIRAKAVSAYSSEQQAKSYVELFRKLNS